MKANGIVCGEHVLPSEMCGHPFEYLVLLTRPRIPEHLIRCVAQGKEFRDGPSTEVPEEFREAVALYVAATSHGVESFQSRISTRPPKIAPRARLWRD